MRVIAFRLPENPSQLLDLGASVRRRPCLLRRISWHAVPVPPDSNDNAWVSTSVSLSTISSIVADRLFGGGRMEGSRWFFFVGQSRARWPCLPHSKHHPVLRYSSFSRSVFTFHATADVSMAFGSRRGRCCRAGCWLLLRFPCLLCPGRRQ